MKTIDYSVEAQASLHPQSSAAGTVNGGAVDKKDFLDGRLVGQVGAASGSPSAQSVIFKIQESADGSTGWADVTNGAIAAVAADDQIVDLEVPDIHKRERYLRAVATVSFTGGSSPEIPFSALFELGKKDQEPVA